MNEKDIFLFSGNRYLIDVYKKSKLLVLPKGEIITGCIYIKRSDIVRDDFAVWRLFPTINVDRTECIPCDYPGAMGVPNTALPNLMGGRNDKKSGFVMLDLLHDGKVNGTAKYKRIIIRNLYPKLPEVVDLRNLLRRCGVEIVVVKKEGEDKQHEDE